MLLIDKYAYFNRLRHAHPVEKTTLSLGLLLFSLIAKDSLVSLITFLVMSTFVVWAARIPFSYYGKLLLAPVFFLLSGVITLLFSVTDGQASITHPIWNVYVWKWQIFISQSSMEQVVNLIFRVLGGISCLYFLILTTPITVMLGLLRKLRLPPLLLDLIALTYRFIFVFLETAAMIHQAQTSRLGYITIRQSLKSLGQLVATLFLKSFHRSSQLTIAMDSRCYENDIVLVEQTYPVSFLNWFLIVGIFTALLTVYWQFGGY